LDASASVPFELTITPVEHHTQDNDAVAVKLLLNVTHCSQSALAVMHASPVPAAVAAALVAAAVAAAADAPAAASSSKRSSRYGRLGIL